MKIPFFKAHSFHPAAVFSFLGMVVVLPVVAQAGFEWRGPIAPQVPAPAIPPAATETLTPALAPSLVPVMSPGAPAAAAAPVAPVSAKPLGVAAPTPQVEAASGPVTLVPVRRMDTAPQAPMPAPAATPFPAPTLSAPEIEWGAPPVTSVVTALPVVPLPPAVEKAEPVSVAAQGVAAPEPKDQTAKDQIVEGFGRNLPLAMAVTQVLPSGYGVAFGAGVNPGVKVSWQGGKLWKQVLSDMLAARRLAFRVEDNAIVIFRVGQATPPAPMPLLLASAPPADITMPDLVQAPLVEDIPPAMPVMEPPSSPLPEITAGQTPDTTPETAPAPVMWRAEGGQMLRAVLSDWSRRAGVELYWATDYDYRVPYGLAFTGAYQDATRQLIAQFAALNPRPYARLHEAPGGARVLAVRSADLLDSRP